MERASMAATAYGTGLQGMADRLDAIGGTLQVASRPGEGTSITSQITVSAVSELSGPPLPRMGRTDRGGPYGRTRSWIGAVARVSLRRERDEGRRRAREGARRASHGSAAAFVAADGNFSVLNGGCGPVLANGSVTIRNGGCGPLVANGDVSIENGGAQVVVASGGATIGPRAFVGVVISPNVTVEDGGRVLMRSPLALAVGAAPASRSR